MRYTRENGGFPMHEPLYTPSHRLALPRRLLVKAVSLTDQGLMNGARVVAGPGAGKSRWAGRGLVWQKLIRGHPLIALDPTGAVVANIFDKVCSMPQQIQEALWPRIKYVDMAATDYVIPMPLYERRSEGDTLLAIANRFLEVMQRVDPYLHTASVEGMNALVEAGAAAGMMAAALGGQITDVAAMLAHPEQWKQQFAVARRSHPELQLAYDYFQQFTEIKNPALRRRQTGSLLIKLIPFLADPAMRARFAAPRPGLDLRHEMEQGHAVFYDFQGEHDPVRRRLKLLWCFLQHVEYAKTRGIAGRRNPILYLIDEITQLLGHRTLEHSLMADDINELTTVLARNYGLNVCIMHQNLSQIDEYTQVSLGQLGTQIVGWVQEPRDCLRLAEQFFRYDATMVRKTEPVWMNVQYGAAPLSYTVPEIIDYRTTEYTADEQYILAADAIRTLGRFRFLVRIATAEGTLSPHVQPMRIDTLDAGCYPDDALVAEVRRRLRKRDGVPLETLGREIEEQRHTPVTVAPPRAGKRQTPAKKGKAHDRSKKSTPVQQQDPDTISFWEEDD
jgi:hypothetical protein